MKKDIDSTTNIMAQVQVKVPPQVQASVVQINQLLGCFAGIIMDPEREFAAGNLDPLRVRLRPARACQDGEANRCSLFLHCTLTSHITLFFLYLFKVVDLQVPCDSSRAKGGVLGASEIESGSQN